MSRNRLPEALQLKRHLYGSRIMRPTSAGNAVSTLRILAPKL